MTSKVATSDRNVGDVCGTVLVAALLVMSVLLLVGPVASAAYIAEDIGCSGYYTTLPGGINDQDQIAAWRIQTSSGSGQDAVIYYPGTGVWGVLPDFGTELSLYSRAFDINNYGEVIGMCIQPLTYTAIGAYWPAPCTRLVPLEPLPGDPVSFAYAVNDLREAVGYSRSEIGPNTIVKWSLDHYATSIMPTELGVLYEMEMALPKDINNNHAIVGWAYNYSGGVTSQGFYYAGSGENFQLLPHLSEVGAESSAEAISDSGLIAGWSRDDEGNCHAVVWPSPYDTVVDLGAIVGPLSCAYDISTDEKIVGISYSMGCGFVCDFTTETCEYLPNPPGLSPCAAMCVNDNGHIAGIEADEYLGEEYHAVLWTPDTPPVAAFTAAISGFNVTVDASASYDAEGAIRDYRWDFGDGALGFEMIMTHTYTDVGPYTITLSVNDSGDQFDILTLVVSFDKTPESEILELVALIESTSFEQEIKDRLKAKALKALDLIEIRKKGGDNGPANILLSLDNLVSNYVLAGDIASEYEAWDVIAQNNFVISLLAENHILGGVPIYTWYHGCGPTAAGMLLGYWDATGFDDLVKGPQGNEMFQSEEVNMMIASQSHIDDYVYPLDGWVEVNGEEVWVDLQPDKSELGGATDDDCIADFMHTSRSAEGLLWGQSYAEMVDEALMGYTDWSSGGRYVGTASVFHQGSMSWEDLQAQVDAAHPMVFVVDWDGDGESDHLVTVMGYCEIGNVQLYAFYSTWDNNVWWALFDIMKEGNFYGVFAATTFSVANAA